MHREPEALEAEAQVTKCFDGHARITSKELAQLYSVKNGILPSACSTSPKMEDKCPYAHRQVDKQPSKKSKKNGDKSSVAILKNTRQLGCVFSGYGAAEVFIHFAEELKHTEANPMCSIHKSRVTSRQHSRPKSIAWKVILISANPNAPKFEDRSQEETEWQERCAVEQRGGWPKIS